MALRGTGHVLDNLKTGHYRWIIVLLCFFSTVNNYIDRQILAVLAPFIRGDLGLTDGQYAAIANAYMLGSILGLLVAGPFMDRFGARWGFAIAVIVWSVGGGMTAFATGFTFILVCRFILGVGDSGNWPGASKAITEWFPAKERGIAMGFFNGGVSIGAILAPPAVLLFVWLTGGEVIDVEPLANGGSEVLSPSDAWRWPFLISALLGIPWIGFWLYYYYEPEKHPHISDEEMKIIMDDRALRPTRRTKSVLKKQEFWGIFFARMITSPVWFFIITWLFLYLNREYGFDLMDMAMIAWVPFATADVGNILGGYFSGKLVAGGMTPIRARKRMMLAGALLMMSSFLVGFTENPWIALSIISFLTFSWGIWVSNMLALASDSFPSAEMASVISWSSLGQYGGSVVFIWFTGYALDIGLGYGVVFAVAALLPIIGYIFTWWLNEDVLETGSAA
ncbi:MAG: MFS transporter [Balneolaceae bacterium]